VLARSADRVAKERSMRRRQLKWLWKRLNQLQEMKLRREDLLMKLGAARQQAPSVWRLVEIEVEAAQAKFTYRLNKDKLRQVRRREGRYLLRSNLTETDPAVVWNYYLQLVEVEQAFRHLKGDLAVRPIFHQNEARIEAHIFVSFLAYGLHVTLGRWLRTLAPGLTARSVLEKFAALQMVDVQIPTSDDRVLVLQRYTHPEPELQLLLERLKLELPAQPPPRITVASGQMDAGM
jgi:transposase